MSTCVLRAGATEGSVQLRFDLVRAFHAPIVIVINKDYDQKLAILTAKI